MSEDDLFKFDEILSIYKGGKSIETCNADKRDFAFTLPNKQVVVVGRETIRKLRIFSTQPYCVQCKMPITHVRVGEVEKPNYRHNLFFLNVVGKDETLITIDHIKAKMLGGKNGVNNVQTMCVHCNHLKGQLDQINTRLERELRKLETKGMSHNDAKNRFNAFLSNCRKIADNTKVCDRDDHQALCAQVGGVIDSAYNTKTYRDDVVGIVMSLQPSQAMQVVRQQNNNPCIMVLDDGEILRANGEWVLIEDHVANLASNLI